MHNAGAIGNIAAVMLAAYPHVRLLAEHDCMDETNNACMEHSRLQSIPGYRAFQALVHWK